MPPEEVSAGRDGDYGSLRIDSAMVDYGTGAVGLDDLIFRPTNLTPGGTETIYGATCGLGRQYAIDQ